MPTYLTPESPAISFAKGPTRKAVNALKGAMHKVSDRERRKHPYDRYVESLPQIVDYTPTHVQYYTTAEAKQMFSDFKLPKKGDALLIEAGQGDSKRFTRVSRLPKVPETVQCSGCTYVAEYFKAKA